MDLPQDPSQTQSWQTRGSTRALAADDQRVLAEGLAKVFGAVGTDRLLPYCKSLQRIAIAGGQVLFQEGDASDAVYFVITGRLAASVAASDGGRTRLGDIRPGDCIGETGVMLDQPRTATIVASRDAVLLAITAADFRQLLRTFPEFSIHVARVAIDRVQASQRRRALAEPPKAVAVVPISDGIDGTDWVRRLAAAFAAHGNTCTILARALERQLGAPLERLLHELVQLNEWRDDCEAHHTFMLYDAGGDDPAWTRYAMANADEVLLLADADAAPSLHPREHLLQELAASGSGRRQRLILLHRATRRMPRGTASWLSARPEVSAHLHLRLGHAADLARAARAISGNAIGLVLSGGGARGFAHVGTMRALAEAGVPIDLVGGTSIGAVMGAWCAFDLPVDEIASRSAQAFRVNPTRDLNLLPMLSLLKGRRLKRAIDEAIRAASGADLDCEDTWKTYFCVASNYTHARAEVVTRGNLAKMIRASVSIPGALPPVFHNGEILFDGGTFNNFPVDVMRAMGAGKVIGVNLMRQSDLTRLTFDEPPSTWQLLLDKYLRRKERRRFSGLPSLGAYLFNVSMICSAAQQRAARDDTDLCFEPTFGKVGMLEWHAAAEIADIGYRHAREKLAAHAWRLLAEGPAEA
jgi:NTE family protein